MTPTGPRLFARRTFGVFLRVVDVLIAERDNPKRNAMEKPKQKPANGA
jgi:hypothetical protein